MKSFRTWSWLMALWAGCIHYSSAQGSPPTTVQQSADSTTEQPASPVTLFNHPDARWWVSGQANSIFQAHGDFPALYSGPHSFGPGAETAISYVTTLYTGYRFDHGFEVQFDLESTGGEGLSAAFGLAGFTNLDVVRNPSLGAKPYMARFMLHQTWALSRKLVDNDNHGPFSLASKVPERRLEFRIGKMGVADFFDLNAVGSDSHLQFANWALANNGAYDYAADTRGYTLGAMVEYQQPNFAARFGEFLMPQVANGIDLEFNLRKAHAENLELEFRPQLFKGRKTVLRPLFYFNHANMGDYAQAIAAYLSGIGTRPIIENYRHQDSLKYGICFNGDQQLSGIWRIFLRWGWNEGRHESFAYTEVNNTFSFGTDVTGAPWRRKNDKVGSAFVSNGLSELHKEYLQLGGLGFLLGDGNLRYGRENIWETYYTAHVWRGFYGSGQLSFIANPGYNQDRGPVWVPGFRVHVEF